MLMQLGITKKTIGVLVVSLLTLGGVVGFTQGAEANGTLQYCTATEVSSLPFVNGKVVISTPQELIHFSKESDAYETSSIVLRSDIDVSSCYWTPIGYFAGEFDGAGNTIEFDINKVSGPVGFFATLEGATVMNLKLAGSISANASRVGGIAGEALSSSEIINSSFEGDIEGSGVAIGGLVGYLGDSEITHSFSSGSVIGDDEVGGLVGNAELTTVQNSSFEGDIEGSGVEIGGLIGLLVTSSLTESFSSGSVKGAVVVGGLVGSLEDSEITRSFSTMSATGVQDVGGLVGSADSTLVRDSFSTGDVIVSGSAAGGFVGWFNNSLSIETSYSSGAVKDLSSSNSNIGQFAGVTQETVRISNAVFRSDADHSMTTTRQIGSVDSNVDDLFSKTSVEMQDQDTFQALDWDFTSVWTMSPIDSEFNGFPILKWQTLGSSQQSPTGSGAISSAPQTTITSAGSALSVNLNKSRALRLTGSNLNLVTEARVAGKRAIINFGASNSGNLVIARLPLLPSGKYTLTLLTASGLVAGEVEVVKKAKIIRLRAIEGSGKLNAKVRSAIRKQNSTYASAGTLRCWGVTTSSRASDLALAKQKAEAACAFAKKRNPELDVVASARTGNGKPARNQVVKLRYLK